jgi:hypothetical protein
MRIRIGALRERGFHCEVKMDGKEASEITIWPDNGRDISEKLRELTDLPMRDCFALQEEIVDLQIINVLKQDS